jgi:CheY-specific phosphatase CheX
MDFLGDVNGQFVMLFPEEKSKEVMSNFLGLDSNDPELSEMSHFDAAAEIMNILGAHILSSWLKDKGHFKIGLPLTSTFKTDEQEVFLKDKNITGMLIDGEPVFLKIVFKPNE